MCICTIVVVWVIYCCKFVFIRIGAQSWQWHMLLRGLPYFHCVLTGWNALCISNRQIKRYEKLCIRAHIFVFLVCVVFPLILVFLRLLKCKRHFPVAGKLPEFKWLHGGVKFEKSLPRTTTGKIQKQVLRKMFCKRPE